MRHLGRKKCLIFCPQYVRTNERLVASRELAAITLINVTINDDDGDGDAMENDDATYELFSFKLSLLIIPTLSTPRRF